MSIPNHMLSNRIGDYQKVRAETVTLVTALSNSLSGLGNVQPGISLIYPAEGLAEDGKAFTRIFFISPVELAKNSLDDADIANRLREVVATTPIRFDPKKNENTFLDVTSQEYIALQHRLLPIIGAASQNFRKDIADLLVLFDAYTQPSAKIPAASTYHIRTAFNNRELINAYRTAQGMPIPEPSLTKETREMLTRRGVSTHGIADRSEGAQAEAIAAHGLLASALPNNAEKLREAAQGSQYGREVQMILHVLGEAIVRGEIPNLVMDHAFREALSRVIADARPGSVAAALEAPLEPPPLAQ